jgi:dihydrofolate reductase
MSRVVWHVTMSLDGFIAGPDDAMDWAFEQAGDGAMAEQVRETTGAILAGRRWYDVATRKYGGRGGIYGGAWTGPVFVLTHRPLEVPEDPAITFLSEGIEHAVATGRAASGDDQNLEIFGADLARQCLHAGLLEDIVVHLAPVLLGDGVRFYAVPGGARVDLERADVDASGPVTSLRFRMKPPRP